jgi:hypothetical protein
MTSLEGEVMTLPVMMMLRMRPTGLSRGMGRVLLKRKVKRKKKMKEMRKRMREMRKNQPRRLCQWFLGPDMVMAQLLQIILEME